VRFRQELEQLDLDEFLEAATSLWTLSSRNF
jgi:hypothetical protein